MRIVKIHLIKTGCRQSVPVYKGAKILSASCPYKNAPLYLFALADISQPIEIRHFNVTEAYEDWSKEDLGIFIASVWVEDDHKSTVLHIFEQIR